MYKKVKYTQIARSDLNFKLYHEILFVKDLSLTEKCILSFICSSNEEKGYFVLDNEQISNVIHVTKSTVSKTINSLIKKGYIKKHFDFNYSTGEKLRFLTLRKLSFFETFAKENNLNYDQCLEYGFKDADISDEEGIFVEKDYVEYTCEDNLIQII